MAEEYGRFGSQSGLGWTFVPEGEFYMGSDEEGRAERPQHSVNLSPYWMAVTSVTNRDFEAFVRATGYVTTAEKKRTSSVATGVGPADKEPCWQVFTVRRKLHPVVSVSWFDAQAYCQWLAESTGLPFRLPTEAEWEKAARGGLHNATFPWGDQDARTVGANFGHIGVSSFPRTLPVQHIPRNGFGMHFGGNAWEWVSDWYDERYYEVSPYRDPTGPTSGVFKVRRGGAFNNRRSFRLGVASRNRLAPQKAMVNMTFRVCRDALPSEVEENSQDRVRALHQLSDDKTARFQAPSDAVWDSTIRSALVDRSDLNESVNAVLDVLRPNMELDEGGVKLVRIDGRTAYLQMMGTCFRCPKSDRTFADIAASLVKHVKSLDSVKRIGD